MVKKINVQKLPLPGKGAKIIQNDGLVVKKGGSALPAPVIKNDNTVESKKK